MTSKFASLFVRQIAIPQDHGSWVFLLSPLLIGAFASKAFGWPSALLALAALTAFLLRQPLTVMVKAYSGRRPRHDLATARFWVLVYGTILLILISLLAIEGYAFILFLAVPAAPVFAWHLYLVSRRRERKQPGIEILATGILALAAPAIFWIGKGNYHPAGWTLWLLTWLQSAASIVHAYLRLEQRSLPATPPRPVRWKMGRRAFLYTSFNLGMSLIAGQQGLLPPLLFLPYLLQWLETWWGIEHPAAGWKPARIGLRQLLVSTLFTILFILVWR
jgi:hypothetical protein